MYENLTKNINWQTSKSSQNLPFFMRNPSYNICPRLKKMLSNQLSHESYNAHLYLKISNILKVNGLDNLGKHFEGQFAEENSHQGMLVNYFNDRNELVEVQATNAVTVNPKGIIEIAEAYLAQEQLTTSKLKNIAQCAWEEKDMLTFKFLQDMLQIQRVEEDEATTFLDQANLTKGEGFAVLLWNQTFEV